MSLQGLIVGDYGQTIQLTVTDIDTSAAANVSTYTSAQQVQIKDPDDNIATETAGFDSDGSDGLVNYTTQDGDIDEPGVWALRVRLTAAAAVLTSQWLEFSPEE